MKKLRLAIAKFVLGSPDKVSLEDLRQIANFDLDFVAQYVVELNTKNNIAEFLTQLKNADANLVEAVITGSNLSQDTKFTMLSFLNSQSKLPDAIK